LLASNRTNYANGGCDARAFRSSYHSTNVRHCCMVHGNSSLGVFGKWWFEGLYYLFQWVSPGRQVSRRGRIGLDNVWRPEVVTGQFCKRRTTASEEGMPRHCGASILRSGRCALADPFRTRDAPPRVLPCCSHRRGAGLAIGSKVRRQSAATVSLRSWVIRIARGA
jgi:hypothetical protein